MLVMAFIFIAVLLAGVPVFIALAGASFWHAFVDDVRGADIPASSAWLDTTGAVVEAQLRRHGSSIRRRSMPLTITPMGVLSDPIRDAIAPRRCGFKNPRRLNSLLMLMQLHANGQADEHAYAATIRAWLQAHDDRPQIDRRVLANLRRIGSL